MHNRFIAVAILFFIAGCATPYQESGLSGGVVASAITTDTYRISARGNAYTDAATVQDYVLLKAAETTTAAGATHFLILGGQDRTKVLQGQTAGTMNTNIVNGSIQTTYSPGVQYDMIKPGQDTMIQVITIPAGTAAPQGAFNAAEVFAAVNPRIKRPTGG